MHPHTALFLAPCSMHNETINIWTHLIGNPAAWSCDVAAAAATCVSRGVFLGRAALAAPPPLTACPPPATHAGFLMFVALAIFLANHPPTPLALRAEHLDHVWSRVEVRSARRPPCWHKPAPRLQLQKTMIYLLHSQFGLGTG